MTLTNLLIFLGVVVGVVAVVTALYLWWTSGKQPPTVVPGSASFATNVTNAETLIEQIGQLAPTPAQCTELRQFLANAQAGFSEMQNSGQVDSSALNKAEQRLSKIKSYLDEKCE